MGKGKRLARPSQVRRWCIAKLVADGVKGEKHRSWWCFKDEEIAVAMGLTANRVSHNVATRMLEAAFLEAGKTVPKTRAPRSGPVKTYKPAESDFLQTYEWRRLRMAALTKYGARCQCCGATPATGAVMNVDHIKPRKLFPQLALDINNLQILCAECNHGKGNWDMTDWRGHVERCND